MKKEIIICKLRLDPVKVMYVYVRRKIRYIGRTEGYRCDKSSKDTVKNTCTPRFFYFLTSRNIRITPLQLSSRLDPTYWKKVIWKEHQADRFLVQ